MSVAVSIPCYYFRLHKGCFSVKTAVF